MKKIHVLFVLIYFSYAFSLGTVVFREGSESDLSALVATHYVAWHTTYDAMLHHAYCLKNTPERLEKYWKKFFTKQKCDDRFVLVALEGDEIVGFIAAGPIKYIPKEDDELPSTQYDAEVYKLYVNPRKQGCGIGKNLMRETFERLFAHKYTKIIVRVFEQNKAASLFYERCGGILLRQEPFVYDPLLPYQIYIFDVSSI